VRLLAAIVMSMTLSGCLLRASVQTVDVCEGGREIRDIAYWNGADFNDEKHRLDLYVPAGPGPHPVVVFVHGGGWILGDRQQIGGSYIKLGRRFAALGVLTMVVSYRLAPRFKHPAQVRDVSRALAWAFEHAPEYGGDPQRLFAMGHSAGAHLVALAATDSRWLAEVDHSPAELKGVIGVSGPYDVEHLGRSTLVGGLPMVIPAFGSDPSTWRDAMPANHLKTGTIPPFVVAWADGDPELVRRDARVFTQALKRARREVSTYESGFDDHFSVITDFGGALNPLAELVMKFIRPVPVASRP
jgi:arylformamidase